jgi:hypothetical protein
MPQGQSALSSQLWTPGSRRETTQRNQPSGSTRVWTSLRLDWAKKAHFRAAGHEVVAESLSGRFRVAYVDTVEAFGFSTEVVERTPGFLAQLQVISRTCSGWDGRDPVRLLTRDGYRVPGTGGA